MRNMLSQDNYPSPASGTKPSLRLLIAGISTATLAFLGLMVTTTQLQWKLPAFDGYEEALALPEAKSSQATTPAIKQLGDNITIEQLPYDYGVPVTSSGMPEFYKTVLKPEGKMTELGLTQRKARINFGYDRQDIFTAKMSEGAYVLHCQRLKTTTTRAMCWRQLQLSDKRWIQYRFPRSQLKDWRKIEQTVRANIT